MHKTPYAWNSINLLHVVFNLVTVGQLVDPDHEFENPTTYIIKSLNVKFRNAIAIDVMYIDIFVRLDQHINIQFDIRYSGRIAILLAR